MGLWRIAGSIMKVLGDLHNFRGKYAVKSNILYLTNRLTLIYQLNDPKSRNCREHRNVLPVFEDWNELITSKRSVESSAKRRISTLRLRSIC